MKSRLLFLRSASFAVVVTVAAGGLAGTLLLWTLMSHQVTGYFDVNHAASLRLASLMGVEVCEERFNDLLSMGLSEEPGMMQTMRNDALNRIGEVPGLFSRIELVVIENRTDVLLSTGPEPYSSGMFQKLPVKFPSDETIYRLESGPLVHWRYFPLWRWHIVAIMSTEDATIPGAFIGRMIVYVLAGMIAFFIVSFFAVFIFRISRPLSVIARTAEAVRGGRMIKTGIKRRDEIGLAAGAFDEMVEGLDLTIKELEKTAEQKEQLLSEVHHRVRNNLNIIISLINLQAANLSKSDPAKAAVFEDTKLRIMTMSVIHGTLYESGNFGLIDVDTFIPELAGMIQAGFNIYGRIGFRFDIAQVSLSLNQAVPLGLLLNEIVTNSFKHAFPSDRDGIIFIGFTERDGICTLNIHDNGIGAEAEGFMEKSSLSLGIRLIYELASQLGGDPLFSLESGVRVELSFPLGTPSVEFEMKTNTKTR